MTTDNKTLADEDSGGINNAAEQPINFVQALRLEIEIADTYAPSHESVQLRIVTMRRDVAAGLLASLEGMIEAMEYATVHRRGSLPLAVSTRLDAALARVKGESA